MDLTLQNIAHEIGKRPCPIYGTLSFSFNVSTLVIFFAERAGRPLHDEFTSTSARSSDVVDKREYLASIPRLEIRECQLRDVSVRSIENVGIVKARLICESTAADLDIHDDLLITDVWIKAGNLWKVVTRHASCRPGR